MIIDLNSYEWGLGLLFGSTVVIFIMIVSSARFFIQSIVSDSNPEDDAIYVVTPLIYIFIFLQLWFNSACTIIGHLINSKLIAFYLSYTLFFTVIAYAGMVRKLIHLDSVNELETSIDKGQKYKVYFIFLLEMLVTYRARRIAYITNVIYLLSSNIYKYLNLNASTEMTIFNIHIYPIFSNSKEYCDIVLAATITFIAIDRLLQSFTFFRDSQFTMSILELTKEVGKNTKQA